MVEQELRKRIVTAVVLVLGAGLLLSLPLFTEHGLWILCSTGFLLVGLCAGEFARVCVTNYRTPVRGVIYFLVICTPAFFTFLMQSIEHFSAGGVGWNQFMVPLLAFSLTVPVALAYIVFYPHEHIAQAVVISQDLLPGLVHVGLGGACLVALAALPDTPQVIVWLLLVVCAGDIAAYFGGRAIGGPKLSVIVSPNKTVSGSLCGLAAGMLAGLAGGILLSNNADIMLLLLVGLVVGFAAQIGDLTKSYVKRLHGVKDTGSILPGHGGVLDRLDGVLLGAAVLYALLACGVR